MKKFNQCRRNNLNAIWAAEKLYVPGNSTQQFINILEHNMKPIYESARLQGYDTWKVADSTKYVPVENNIVVSENDFLAHSDIKVENDDQSKIVFGQPGGTDYNAV